ncbi:hypothetical protein C9374_013319 [Naegleria lovaniensis]|uniref:Uncharacterized protein n=1 Tax=Naegleria lovaniensis TaxID=51637 RepID=A0AA88H133_NAELO|nr:uncharacterized protein C9374_013319 [Naegleria lovaniensis]KAG2391834.1 hypothetical protein C9374_013319 [Naegleria lovaniensis]
MFKGNLHKYQRSSTGAPKTSPQASNPPAAQPPLNVMEGFVCRFLEGCVRGICDVFIETISHPVLAAVLRYIKIIGPVYVPKIYSHYRHPQPSQ